MHGSAVTNALRWISVAEKWKEKVSGYGLMRCGSWQRIWVKRLCFFPFLNFLCVFRNNYPDFYPANIPASFKDFVFRAAWRRWHKGSQFSADAAVMHS
jgi:hypothetical protein